MARKRKRRPNRTRSRTNEADSPINADPESKRGDTQRGIPAVDPPTKVKEEYQEQDIPESEATHGSEFDEDTEVEIPVKNFGQPEVKHKGFPEEDSQAEYVHKSDPENEKNIEAVLKEQESPMVEHIRRASGEYPAVDTSEEPFESEQQEIDDAYYPEESPISDFLNMENSPHPRLKEESEGQVDREFIGNQTLNDELEAATGGFGSEKTVLDPNRPAQTLKMPPPRVAEEDKMSDAELEERIAPEEPVVDEDIVDKEPAEEAIQKTYNPQNQQEVSEKKAELSEEPKASTIENPAAIAAGNAAANNLYDSLSNHKEPITENDLPIDIKVENSSIKPEPSPEESFFGREGLGVEEQEENYLPTGPSEDYTPKKGSDPSVAKGEIEVPGPHRIRRKQPRKALGIIRPKKAPLPEARRSAEMETYKTEKDGRPGFTLLKGERQEQGENQDYKRKEEKSLPQERYSEKTAAPKRPKKKGLGSKIWKYATAAITGAAIIAGAVYFNHRHEELKSKDMIRQGPTVSYVQDAGVKDGSFDKVFVDAGVKSNKTKSATTAVEKAGRDASTLEGLVSHSDADTSAQDDYVDAGVQPDTSIADASVTDTRSPDTSASDGSVDSATLDAYSSLSATQEDASVDSDEDHDLETIVRAKKPDTKKTQKSAKPDTRTLDGYCEMQVQFKFDSTNYKRRKTKKALESYISQIASAGHKKIYIHGFAGSISKEGWGKDTLYNRLLSKRRAKKAKKDLTKLAKKHGLTISFLKGHGEIEKGYHPSAEEVKNIEKDIGNRNARVYEKASPSRLVAITTTPKRYDNDETKQEKANRLEGHGFNDPYGNACTPLKSSGSLESESSGSSSSYAENVTPESPVETDLDKSVSGEIETQGPDDERDNISEDSSKKMASSSVLIDPDYLEKAKREEETSINEQEDSPEGILDLTDEAEIVENEVDDYYSTFEYDQESLRESMGPLEYAAFRAGDADLRVDKEDTVYNALADAGLVNTERMERDHDAKYGLAKCPKTPTRKYHFAEDTGSVEEGMAFFHEAVKESESAWVERRIEELTQEAIYEAKTAAAQEKKDKAQAYAQHQRDLDAADSYIKNVLTPQIIADIQADKSCQDRATEDSYNNIEEAVNDSSNSDVYKAA